MSANYHREAKVRSECYLRLWHSNNRGSLLTPNVPVKEISDREDGGKLTECDDRGDLGSGTKRFRGPVVPECLWDPGMRFRFK